jgi:hypothetical protein
MKPIESVLQPKQTELGKLFYQASDEAAVWIGGGGSRSGGKSGGLRRIMLDRRYSRPGTAGCIVRRTWPDLRRNHVEPYMREFPQMRDWWGEGKQRFDLPNGSTIEFMYAENQAEVDKKFWGPEFYDIMVDQAEQFSEQELITIKTANRCPEVPNADCKMGLFFNPGGIGTEFLRRVFSQKRFHCHERATDYSFVHLFGWDNFVWFTGLGLTPKQFYAMPGMCKSAEGAKDFMCCRFHLFINRTAEGRKLNSLPPSLRAGHLMGSFDSFAGQYYAGVWDESKLILTARQEQALIQPWWNRWMAQDHGFVHHAAVGWFASGRVSPKLFFEVFGVEIPFAVDVVVIYRCDARPETEEGEYIRIQVGQMPPHELKMIKRYFIGWSPDVVARTSSGHSPKDTMNEELRRAGLPWLEEADDGRVPGWRFLYAMMKKTADVLAGKLDPTRDDDDFEDEEKSGGYSLKTPLLFISGDCTDVIESIPMLVRDNKHPGRTEDVLKMPTKADDVGDMVRYGVKSMMNPRGQAPVEVRRAEYQEELGDVSMTSKSIALMNWDTKNKPRRGSGWASRQ